MPDPITTTDEVATAFTETITILDAYRNHDHTLMRRTFANTRDPGLTIMTMAAMVLEYMGRAGLDDLALNQFPTLREHVRELAA
ncbi:hypothetical protein [Nocardia fluminea]|uniref:hypothetical protein n=1 Tax=Nocardia fluminea TaxID=134984 RepID=UPI003653315A